MHKNPLDRKKCQAEWYIKNKALIGKKNRDSYIKRRALHLVWEAKRRALRKGVPFGLNADDTARIQATIDLGVCEITGSIFDLETNRAWNSPSLDQITAGRGYVRDNVRVVCRAMNFAMGEWGEYPVWQMFKNWEATASLSSRPSRSSKRT
jgi:hypothetical protein